MTQVSHYPFFSYLFFLLFNSFLFYFNSFFLYFNQAFIILKSRQAAQHSLFASLNGPRTWLRVLPHDPDSSTLSAQVAMRISSCWPCQR